MDRCNIFVFQVFGLREFPRAASSGTPLTTSWYFPVLPSSCQGTDTVEFSSLQYSTVQCIMMQYSIIQCSTVLWSDTTVSVGWAEIGLTQFLLDLTALHLFTIWAVLSWLIFDVGWRGAGGSGGFRWWEGYRVALNLCATVTVMTSTSANLLNTPRWILTAINGRNARHPLEDKENKLQRKCNRLPAHPEHRRWQNSSALDWHSF